MNIAQEPSVSVFAQLVDRLKDKSEAELKLLYMKLFSEELEQEWQEITQTADFSNATDEDIVKAIQEKRYKK